MEIIKNEMSAVSEAAQQAQDAMQMELSELQLSLVGGGCADPLFM